jgi:hypothetical protein
VPPPGLLILDNNCYAALAVPKNLARFRANLRVTDFIAQPSEVNLLESTSASPDSVQERLLVTIRDVAAGQPLLQWPFKLLQQIGQAIVDGKTGFIVEPSGKEWYLDDLNAAREIRTEVLEFQRGIEKTFSGYHASNRQKLQKKLRARGIKDEFGSTQEFLEGEWTGSEMRRIFAEVTWTALHLPGVAPLEILEENEAWSLLLDAEDVAIYERAVAKTQPKPVHRLDLIQLVYLGASRRRMIVTGDGGLLRAADAILTGRYPNARAVNISELIA